MDEPSFADVDFDEVLLRLTRYAQGLSGAARLLGPGPVEIAWPGGDGPVDMARTLLVRFLDPADTRVAWKRPAIRPTTALVCAYLKAALRHDFLDMKKSPAFSRTIYLDNTPSDNPAELTLDGLPAQAESPLDFALSRERVDWLLSQFTDDPKAGELLRLQIDPDGYKAFTNMELAELLGISVSEVENRKKRARNRLLKILQLRERKAVAGVETNN